MSSATWYLLLLQQYLLSKDNPQGASARDTEKSFSGGEKVLQPTATDVDFNAYKEAYVSQEGVLRLARRILNDLHALANLPDAGEDNRQFCHAAYRQFVAGLWVLVTEWSFQAAVWSIRDRFPGPHGQYRGFIPWRRCLACGKSIQNVIRQFD